MLTLSQPANIQAMSKNIITSPTENISSKTLVSFSCSWLSLITLMTCLKSLSSSTDSRCIWLSCRSILVLLGESLLSFILLCDSSEWQRFSGLPLIVVDVKLAVMLQRRDVFLWRYEDQQTGELPPASVYSGWVKILFEFDIKSIWVKRAFLGSLNHPLHTNFTAVQFRLLTGSGRSMFGYCIRYFLLENWC